MKKFIAFLFVTSFILSSCQESTPPASKLSFYGADSKEVLMSYRTYFLLPLNHLETPAQRVSDYRNLSHADKIRIGKALKLHVLHLYGVFSYHVKPVNFAVYSGSIMERGKHKVENVQAVQVNGREFLKINYAYQDRAIFYEELLTGQKTKVRFLMPNIPTEVYEKGFRRRPPKNKQGQPINTCTAHHDNSKEAFWYYWSPDRKGCPQSFRKELHYVDATLQALPETTRTFPEYQRLYSQKRGKDGRGKVRIDLIVGPDEKMDSTKDLGYITYRHTFEYLKRMRNVEGQPTFRILKNSAVHKRLVYSTQLFDADVHIHYKDPDGPDFPQFAAKALRYSDIFIFSGHSYEGEYFDLQDLFQKSARSLPKDKYQIMFFNACTTYAYYNFNYFKAKQSTRDPRGTKNLDLMTNGIGSPFLLDSRKRKKTIVTADILTISSLLGLRLDGKPLKTYRSWQEILGRITANSGFDFTGLTNVMGDEDNPTHAPKMQLPQAK